MHSASTTRKGVANRKDIGEDTTYTQFRPVIYQMLPRLYTNYCESPRPGAPITVNGSGKLNDVNDNILSMIRDMGVTHVWYTGVIEHSHDADYTRFGIKRDNPHVIKGRAGSPYAITDYYDIDPDLAVDVPARMAEFESLVARTHSAGLKVIIDFVPNHVARQYRSDSRPDDAPGDFGVNDNTEMFFSPSNDFFYMTRQQFAPGVNMGSGEDAYVEFPAKASGNDCYTAFPGVNDWYDTVKLNYGVDPWNGNKHFAPIPPVWHKMAHILKFWASKNVDGFRCDMVHMVPLEFWHWVIPQIKRINPDIIFIAEIYEVALYRPYLAYGGFDYLYDKVNLYDTLRGIVTSNVSAASLTSCWQTVEGVADKMLHFLENHDEQRYASPQYAGHADTVLPSLVVSATMNNGAMMIYMGQELGEAALDAEGYSGRDGRTTIFDYWSIEKIRRRLDRGKCQGTLSAAEKKLNDMYTRVLTLCNSEPAIREGSFFDLMYVNYDNPQFDPHRHYAYFRTDDKYAVLIVVNFGATSADIAVNIPSHAFDTLNISPGYKTVTDLLSGARRRLTIAPDSPTTIQVPPYGAVMYRFKKQ